MNARLDDRALFAGTIEWSEPFDKTGSTIAHHSGTWSDLIERLRNAGTHASKDKCPWIKLATFGDRRTATGSLRTNENVVSIHGVEGDYDGEAVTIDQAAALLEHHQIRAAMYPSPSSTKGKPRWRVICPSSRQLPPTARDGLVGLLNGILGGILAPESFTRSQSYYFGGTSTNDYRVVTTEGACIDLVPAFLLPQPIGKRGADDDAGRPTDVPAKGVDPAITSTASTDATWTEITEALAHINPDCSRQDWITVGMGLHAHGAQCNQFDLAFTVWDTWSAKGEKYPGPRDIAQQWRSFRDDKATVVTMGSVFKLAWDSGWTRPQVDASGLFRPTSGHGDWPEPMPLPNALPRVDPFGGALLPAALRGWVMDIAHRMQCPPDYPAVGALVGLSSLIGARAVIQPKARDDWRVVPNLWGAVVGRPGVKKSPALNEVLKPLHRLQAAEFELHKAAHDAWELDCKVSEMAAAGRERQAKGIADKDKAAARALLTPVDAPSEPNARRFVVNDATVEKLGELLQQNEWGTLSYRDELYGLLTSLDKQGQEGSRAFYLTSYDGNQGYTFDRIGRGTVHIPRVCLAMLGGIQPGRIQEYVRGAVAGGSADDGLLQRFGLTVWPDVAGDFVHVDQWPDTPAKQTAWAVFDRLAQLQPASDTDPVIWRFTPAAQEIFVEWLVPFEIELRGDALHPAMVSHLAKYRKLIPALALVFALIDTPGSGNLIDEGEIVRAMAWGDYLRTHANRLYAAAVMPETTDAATLLSKIRGGRLTDGDGVILNSFTPRQIAVKGWAGLDTPDAVRKAADLLADYDWLRRDVVQSGDALGRGRPSDRYTINPAALKGGAA